VGLAKRHEPWLEPNKQMRSHGFRPTSVSKHYPCLQEDSFEDVADGAALHAAAGDAPRANGLDASALSPPPDSQPDEGPAAAAPSTRRASEAASVEAHAADAGGRGTDEQAAHASASGRGEQGGGDLPAARRGQTDRLLFGDATAGDVQSGAARTAGLAMQAKPHLQLQ
jgi:hypothetical protein